MKWFTAACGAVLLLDQLFQWAERMHQGSGPGPLRLPGPGSKSLHTKVGWETLYVNGFFSVHVSLLESVYLYLVRAGLYL